MATKTTTDNLTVALDALTAETGTPVEREALLAYLKRVDEVIDAARAVKDAHKKTLRVEQSRASKERNKAKVAEMAARLAELEAKEAAVSE